MIIERQEKGIVLKKEEENSISDFIESPDLISNYLEFYFSKQDGWSYLYDIQKNCVYWLTDYGFSAIDEFLNCDKVFLPKHPNDNTYKGYEWNEGRPSWIRYEVFLRTGYYLKKYKDRDRAFKETLESMKELIEAKDIEKTEIMKAFNLTYMWEEPNKRQQMVIGILKILLGE